MKIADIYKNHHGASEYWDGTDISALFTRIFDAPGIEVGNKKTREIRDHVNRELVAKGWIMNYKLDQTSQLEVSALLHGHAFQLQTGNVARGAYDLLKIQYLYESKSIEAATLAVPTKFAANAMGDNIANSERLINELKLFDRIVTAPLVVLAFE